MVFCNLTRRQTRRVATAAKSYDDAVDRWSNAVVVGLLIAVASHRICFARSIHRYVPRGNLRGRKERLGARDLSSSQQ